MANELPDVPAVPVTLERGVREVLLSMRQHIREMRGIQGDPNAKAITVGTAGAIGGGGSVIVVPGNPGGGGEAPDPTPPPTPSGTSVSAGIDFLFYQTAAPVFTAGHGYARTKVYGAKWPANQVDGPTFADAVLIDEFVGTVGSTPTDPATRWCVWMKWVSKDGIESTDPSGGTNGQTVTTGQDVTQLLEALEGKLRNEQLDPASNFRFKANLFTIESVSGSPAINPFTVLTAPTMTPAGELLPAGVYMEAAYIKGLEAALARFQTAVITNAMVQSLSATKITSGVISVGNYIQASNYVPGVSGWRIHGDGTAEFGAASIRGRLSANQIDGKGLSIYKPNGEILLDANAAGGALAWDAISGKPDLGNIVNLSFWKRLGAIPWTKNGVNEENTLYFAEELGQKGPRGVNDVVLYAREAAGNGEQGGGWDAPGIFVTDPTKTYRFVVPIYKRDGAGGNAYWGPAWNVCDLNTTSAANNPYFASVGRDALPNDRWHLFVGYVFPYGSTGNSNTGAGIYDCKTGALVAGGANFNHGPGGVNGHRAYQYYSAPGSTQLFGRPMVHVMDGTEPSLASFFETGAISNAANPTNASNMFPNSDLRDGWDQLWTVRWNQNGNPIAVFARTNNVWGDGSWMPRSVLGLTMNTVGQTGAIDMGITEQFPVTPGVRYEFSCSFFSHRCGYGMGLLFVDQSGNAVGGWNERFIGNARDNNAGFPPTSAADRLTIFATAPANAVRADIYLRKGPQSSGGDSWFWAFWPYFSVAAVSQTDPSQYVPGPLRTVRSLGYAGDLNATNGATIGANLFGQFNQSSFDIVMNGQALIRGAHIANLNVGLLSTAWNGGATGAHIELALNKQTFFRANGTKSIELIA